MSTYTVVTRDVPRPATDHLTADVRHNRSETVAKVTLHAGCDCDPRGRVVGEYNDLQMAVDAAMFAAIGSPHDAKPCAKSGHVHIPWIDTSETSGDRIADGAVRIVPGDTVQWSVAPAFPEIAFLPAEVRDKEDGEALIRDEAVRVLEALAEAAGRHYTDWNRNKLSRNACRAQVMWEALADYARGDRTLIADRGAMKEFVHRAAEEQAATRLEQVQVSQLVLLLLG